MSKRLQFLAIIFCFLAGPAFSSCSSHEETTQQTVTTSPDYSDSTAPPATTTTTTTTTDNEPDSVLGSTLHAVGTIILFPFRLVGDAISLIV